MRKVIAATVAVVTVLGGAALVDPASAATPATSTVSPTSKSTTSAAGTVALPAERLQASSSDASTQDIWRVNHWWVGGSDWSWHTSAVPGDGKWHNVVEREHWSGCYDGVFVGISNWSNEEIDHTTVWPATDNDIYYNDNASWYAGNCGSTFSYAPIVYATVVTENWTARWGFQNYDGGRAEAVYHCNNAAGQICNSSDTLQSWDTVESEVDTYWWSDPGHTMSLWTGDLKYINLGVRGWDGRTMWFKYTYFGNIRKRVKD